MQSSASSRLRAFTSAIGFTSSSSHASSDSVTSSDRRFSTSSQPVQSKFTLYLRVHSARNLPAVAQGSYCKLYVGDTPILGGFGEGKSLVPLRRQSSCAPPTHRTFHTKVQLSAQRESPEWNEKFQVNVFNPNTEVLTIRVKNQVLLYSPAVGACVVHLRQLQLGETVDNWFPLFKNDRPAGQIRLQLCLQANAASPHVTRYSGVSDETIERLTQEHRELQEKLRRETEIKQLQQWKTIEEEELKRVGLEGQMLREQRWRQQHNQRAEQKVVEPISYHVDSDEEPPSYSYDEVQTEQEIASNLLNAVSVSKPPQTQERHTEPMSRTLDNNTEASVDSYAVRRTSGFGTIRFSFEDLEDVVHNALPSDSESTSEDEHHTHWSRHESSDSNSISYPSDEEAPRQEPVEQPRYTAHSALKSHVGNQRDPRRYTDSSLSLTFPTSSSDEDEGRHRHRHKTRSKNSSKRRHKSRRYDSSDSSSSVSLSSSISSSEEERLRSKLKRLEAKKKSRSLKSSTSGSRGPARTHRESAPPAYVGSSGDDSCPMLQFSDSMRASQAHTKVEEYPNSSALWYTRQDSGENDVDGLDSERFAHPISKQGCSPLAQSFCY